MSSNEEVKCNNHENEKKREREKTISRWESKRREMQIISISDESAASLIRFLFENKIEREEEKKKYIAIICFY